MLKVAPSILSSDFSKIGEEVRALSDAGADCIHIDVMDGCFVPNITIGSQMVEAIRGCTTLPLDVHLMVDDPLRHIESYQAADIITIHVEASTHIERTISKIKETGKRAGVALNPGTHENTLEYLYDKLDQIIVMTVNPGWGGQDFLSSQLPKIANIKRRIRDVARDIDLQVDGGVTDQTVASCVQAGANVIVAGSYIFASPDYARQIARLRISSSQGAVPY